MSQIKEEDAAASDVVAPSSASEAPAADSTVVENPTGASENVIPSQSSPSAATDAVPETTADPAIVKKEEEAEAEGDEGVPEPENTTSEAAAEEATPAADATQTPQQTIPTGPPPSQVKLEDELPQQQAVQAAAPAPLSATATLRSRIERDRRDGDAWLGLIDDAMQRADLPGLRTIYQDFFQVYPNAARQWQDYASIELSHSEFGNVEDIFTRCLRTTPSTDLWRFYLSYTRRVNPLPPADPSKGGAGEGSERDRVRKIIEGAYEFALRFIGASRDAGDLWRDYIALLKERETANQWQSGQKMDDVRRTYQRAVAVPLTNVEQIWREYDAYENGLNRMTAKKFLGDRSPAYMTARSVLREMRTLTEQLQRPVIARVPCWCMAPSLDPIVSPMTIVRDRHYVEAWKKYLRWEESNPLQFEEADGQSYQSRVLLAYRKATMHMRFYPEIWNMAATFLNKNGREDEATTWLQNGLDACTGDALLTFAFVEQVERQAQRQQQPISSTQECAAKFDALLDWIHGEIEKLDEQLQSKIADIDREAEAAKALAAARKRDEGAAEEMEGEEREQARKREEAREEQRKAEREKVRPKVEELQENAGLVWIKYMHFVRRTEGQRPSRAIFARARKSKHCTWQVFEANALMEYHCSKDVAVATKVFELALKTFGQDEAFVVRYLDFLLSINDDTNARALFERTVGTFTPAERARPIWDRWCAYEYSFGDSASIARIEERLSAIYPDDSTTKRLMQRNTYMDLDVVGQRSLGLRAGTSAVGGAGSSAAERAVAASRESAHDGISNEPLAAVPEERPQPSTKRARFSATPPPSNANRGSDGRGAAIPTGPRGVKRSVSPPSRFVPPPRGEPNDGGGGGGGGGGPSRHTPYFELPPQILYFLDALPQRASFNGPVISADDIAECLTRSNLPNVGPPDFNGPQFNGTPPPQGGAGRPGQQSRGRRGGARGGRRF